MEKAVSVSREEAASVVSCVEAEQVQRLAAQQGVPRRCCDVDDSAEMVEEPGPAFGIEKRSVVPLASTGRELEAGRDAGTDRPRDEVDGFAAEHPDAKWMDVAWVVVGAERDREIYDVVGFEGLI
jgi:hypothetical protein